MDLEKLSMLIKANSNIELSTIIIYLAITLVLTSIIFLIYRATYSGVAYSHNFNVSIVLIGMITAMIMMVIGNNLALSLGMVGALSIVRFRSAIKEPKDIAYLFWAIAVGLSAGTGAIQIAVVGTIVVAATIIFYQINIFQKQNTYLLIVKGEQFDHDVVKSYISNYVKKYRLRMKNVGKTNNEVIYEVRLSEEDQSALIEGLYTVKNVNQVNIVSFKGHLNE